MNIQEACKITGHVICQFPPDDDECDGCQKPHMQLYYVRTCYESDEGDYHCADCVKKMPQEWDDFAKVYELNQPIEAEA